MIKISQKDKSFILLIISVLTVLYALYSMFSYLFFTSSFRHSDVGKIFPQNKKVSSEHWFNVSRPLEASDLKDRIVLLDFWTYACVNCVQVLQEIKKIEEQFGSKLLVIGVHSGKFRNEKDLAEIKKAIIRNDITHPVVNDPDFRIWNSFSINAWPSLVLINPRGKIEKVYVGESESMEVKSGIKKLISKFKYEVNRDPLPIVLEKNTVVSNVLEFPTKLEYGADFTYKSRSAPAVFISNTGKNNIIVTSLSGDIILKIGSGIRGLQDGSFDSAAFNSPQGLLYRAGKLYVADSGNHALRQIDFKSGKVTTLIGSGQKGSVILSAAEVSDGKSFDLASPTDIEFFPNYDNIAIANSGTDQILNYNISKERVSVLAGDGSQGIMDGKYPNNILAQTSDMSVYNRKLYFTDSKSSSLRVMDEAGEVKTLIGKDLFKFGRKNGGKVEALMQHPMGLMVDDTGAYISDSFNHIIRRYDLSSGQISTLVGGKKRGDNLGSGSATEFDQPEGIISVLNNFYVVDSNNNRIVILNRGNFNSTILDVMPPLKLSKEGFLQYLPNLTKLPEIVVKSDAEISLKIDLKKGWKINEMGPSFVNLLKKAKEDQVDLITVIDWQSLKVKEAKLPKLNSKKDYILQGVIYYCEDKKNALCYINSYEQKLVVKSGEKNQQVTIKLAY